VDRRADASDHPIPARLQFRAKVLAQRLAVATDQLDGVAVRDQHLDGLPHVLGRYEGRASAMMLPARTIAGAHKNEAVTPRKHRAASAAQEIAYRDE